MDGILLKKKCAIVVNYFGKPPEYFQLWLDSCSFNPLFTWLFFTDIDESKYCFPRNVRIVKTNLEGLRQRFQGCLPYRVKYSKPWDFCALRPGFGVFFNDYLKGFDYWGWGDCDLINGDLSLCVPALNAGADKVLPRGHLSFVRNDKRLNEYIFNHPLSRKTWEVGSVGEACYDEEAIVHKVLPGCDAVQDNTIPYVNTRCRSGNYVLSRAEPVFAALNLPNDARLPFVMTWRDGRLFGHFAMPGKTVRTLELVYVHFFRRDLRNCVGRLEHGVDYLIVPNKIVQFKGGNLSYEDICRLDRWRFHWAYFKKRLNMRTIGRKLHLWR